MSPGGWIRRQLDRPIGESERRAAFTVVTVVLIAATLLLAMTSTGVPAARHARGPRANRTPIVHARDDTATRWTPAVAATARSTAETFLAGYLPFLYGQVPVSAVRDATGAFVGALEHTPMRVPPGIRRLHPRVVGVTVSRQGPSGAIAVALVGDAEVVHYPIRLILTQSGSHWRVAGLEAML